MADLLAVYIMMISAIGAVTFWKMREPSSNLPM
jgi:hypothetical protein